MKRKMILIEMPSQDFDPLMKASLHRFITDLYMTETEMTQNNSPEELGEKMWNQIFPQGQNTPNQFFWILHEEAIKMNVGCLWLSLNPEEESLFIGDIFVDHEYRGNGYGTKCLELVEKMGKHKFNIKNLELHVSKHNPRAKKLYEAFGFELGREETSGYAMIKKITG